MMLFPSQLAWAQSACQSNEKSSCAVYSDCIEANCNCAATSHNYSGTFGPKYCTRFGAESSFSANGSAWRDKTLLCLKDRISQAYVAHSDGSGKGCDCAAIQAAAIDSHSSCYLDTPSFCQLSQADVRVLARIVDTPDIAKLGFPGLREMGIVLATCYWEEGKDVGDELARAFVDETVAENTEIAQDVALTIISHAIEYAVERAKAEAATALRQLFDDYFPNEIPRG